MVEPFKFYKWKEGNMLDIIFVLQEDLTSSSDVAQYRALEINCIEGDMRQGQLYTYKYKEDREYEITELQFDDLIADDKPTLFDVIFTKNSPIRFYFGE